MTKSELKEARDRDNIVSEECPGPPCVGACEFCPGECVTVMIRKGDGSLRDLTEEEQDHLWVLDMEAQAAERMEA